MSPTAKGIAMMLGTIFLFSIMDVFAKLIGEASNAAMALWARYTGQTIMVAALVLPRLRTVMRTNYPRLQLLRSVFLLVATCCFFLGFLLIGLAEAMAIFIVNPVLVTLGAALLPGERLGPRRILGVGVALLGALIIIRPGSAVFSPYALLPLVAALCYSAYAITTRFVGRDEDAWTSLLYTAAFGAIVLSLVVPFFWVTPRGVMLVYMFAIGAIGAAGHYCLIRAFATTEASILAPFAYAGILFAMIWGVVIFGEYPDLPTYTGALVIVLAGLYVWQRETRAGGGTPAD